MRAVIFALVVAGVMTAVCVAADWPYVRRSFGRAGHRRGRTTAAAQGGEDGGGSGVPSVSPDPRRTPPPDPRTAEGVLTRRLIAEEISASEYRRAMADLAVRDDRRHRLEVPRDPGHPPHPQG